MAEKVKEANGAAAAAPPKGWGKIETDRPLYQSDRGKGDAVQGKVLGLLDMPPANGKSWRAFVVQVTVPVKCRGRDDNPVLAQPGQEILVPASHQLMQHLGRAAANPRACFEVWIKPNGQVKTGAGSLTLFEIYVNPQPFERDGHSRMIAMQSSAPALPEHRAEVAADDIPF